MRPLIVTARLRNGFAASDDWSPSIEGLLGYFAMSGGAPPLERDLEPVAGLPLGVESFGDLWWYQASFPEYVESGRFERSFSKRFDGTVSSSASTRSRLAGGPVLDSRSGPYRNHRLSVVVRLTREIRWHVVGDADAIRGLLGGCTHIGYKRAHGYGHVDDWAVTPASSDSKARFWRMLPVPFAEHHGLTGPSIYWGFRPPAYSPRNKALCRIPDP